MHNKPAWASTAICSIYVQPVSESQVLDMEEIVELLMHSHANAGMLPTFFLVLEQIQIPYLLFTVP